MEPHFKLDVDDGMHIYKEDGKENGCENNGDEDGDDEPSDDEVEATSMLELVTATFQPWIPVVGIIGKTKGRITRENRRGMGDVGKKGWVRSIIKDEQVDVIGLQETKCGMVDDILRGCRGYGFPQLPANGNSGGIILIWDTRVFTCKEAVRDDRLFCDIFLWGPPLHIYGFQAIGPCFILILSYDIVSGCKVRIRLELDIVSRRYKLVKFIAEHNYMLLPKEYKHFTKKQRRMRQAEKLFIVKAANNKIGPTRAHNLLMTIKGGLVLQSPKSLLFINLYKKKVRKQLITPLLHISNSTINMAQFLQKHKNAILSILIFSLILQVQCHQFSRKLSPKSHAFKKQKLIHLHFYFQDIAVGDHPTALRVAEARTTNTSKSGFGATFIIDDPLTEGPNRTSKIIGRAQGMYASADLNIFGLMMVVNFVFLEGKYNGSSFCILGRNGITLPLRELPIVGGTGIFRFARGYAQLKTASLNALGDASVEYNAYVLHY
ncbi:disease resistance-responsive (dirigent-like protein) family protein [Artemisia annua]|uniref:Dirigent protein n=1 Tax=Artemisia annua TaxID=35608 RepID=A0A2U1MPI4_ARTAN|nr:disease resistance-responsive (dirigent-like protein) family protein [Artemisia annua]